MLEKIQPLRGDFSLWRTHTKADKKKSKKPGEAKRRNHCVLIPFFCTTHCFTKGTMYNAVAKAKGLETWKGKEEVFVVKLRQSKREERYF